MNFTLNFRAGANRSAASPRRVSWVDDAGVVARVMPEPKMIGPEHVCARLADLRRLARRYRDLGRGAAIRAEAGAQSPFSSSLPLAG